MTEKEKIKLGLRFLCVGSCNVATGWIILHPTVLPGFTSIFAMCCIVLGTIELLMSLATVSLYIAEKLTDKDILS